MANPYFLPGFQTGFLQGIDVVYRQKDREFNSKVQELELEKARVGLDSERERTTQAREEYEYGKSLRPLQEKQLGLQMAASQESIATSRLQRRKTKLQLDQQERTTAAQEADVYRQKVAALGPRISQNVRNPQYLSDGEALDAFLNHGMLARPDAQGVAELKQAGARFLNMTYTDEINQGVGEPIDDKTAEKMGVPKGTLITGKEIVDFYVKGDKIIVELNVKTNAKTPEGAPWEYRAPITRDRSSKGADEIKEFPLSSIQKIAEAGGNFAQAAKLMKMDADKNGQPFSLDDLGNAIDAALAAGQRQMNPRDRFKVVSGKLVDTSRKDANGYPIEVPLSKGVSPEAALKAIRGVYDKYATEVGAENVDTNVVLQEAGELIAGATGGKTAPEDSKPTKEQIRAAYQAGEMSKEQAKDLMKKYGYISN